MASKGQEPSFRVALSPTNRSLPHFTQAQCPGGMKELLEAAQTPEELMQHFREEVAL